jgi:hypothetical protein
MLQNLRLANEIKRSFAHPLVRHMLQNATNTPAARGKRAAEERESASVALVLILCAHVCTQHRRMLPRQDRPQSPP